jgi:hypothetical protein
MSQLNEWTRVLRGILLLFGLNLAAIVVLFLLSAIIIRLINLVPVSIRNFFYSLNILILMCIAGIGLFQFLYVIPTIIVLARSQRYAQMKGVIIGAAITALLNAGCFIWFTSQFR